MFEHITGNCIDTMEFAFMIDNFDHTCLNLIALAAFVVEAVHIECGTCCDRERCKWCGHGLIPFLFLAYRSKNAGTLAQSCSSFCFIGFFVGITTFKGVATCYE